MKIASSISLVGILILGSALAAYEIDQSRYTYPTPETQSAFLKSYNSASIVDRFQAKQSSFWEHSADSEAGRKFATHHVDDAQHFVISAERKPLLLAATKESILRKLEEYGARVIQQTDSSTGFEVRYELGKSRGLVALDPLEKVDPKVMVGRAPICANYEGAILRVRIAETWSKLAPESRRDWPTLRSPSNTPPIR